MSDNDNKHTPGKRRIRLPSKYESEQVTPVVISSNEKLLDDAKAIISAELSRYLSKARRGATLDLKEARAVQGYMETLVKLQREEREAARAEDLTDLSDEELAQLAKQLAKKEEAKQKLLGSDSDSPDSDSDG